MTNTLHEPNSCRFCGLPQRGHARRWKPPAGWHKWQPPTNEQIKARMHARRAAAQAAEGSGR